MTSAAGRPTLSSRMTSLRVHGASCRAGSKAKEGGSPERGKRIRIVRPVLKPQVKAMSVYDPVRRHPQPCRPMGIQRGRPTRLSRAHTLVALDRLERADGTVLVT